MNKLIITILFLLVNFSISANPISSINTKISFSMNERNSHEIQLELGVIPGIIFGSPLKESLWLENVQNIHGLSLSINNYRKKVKSFSKSVTKAALDSGLIIEPKGTKFARISTFGINKKSKKYGSAGFFDKDGYFLILMYFDRPCKITGTVYLSPNPVDHDIHIKSEGFYWIDIKYGKSRDLLKNINSSTAVNLKFSEQL